MSAALAGRWIDYGDGATRLRGWLSPPPARPGPGVVVVHTFRGLQDRIRARAGRLAALGYPAAAYDGRAEARSWARQASFLAEVLGRAPDHG